MNVVVMIEGHEAIPVRAIPLLTDWETMDSGVIADVLAWDKAYKEFLGLQAFHTEDSLHPIKARWWKNLICQQMKALNESIKAVEVNDETGLQEWRYRSLEILPAGVFVWKDEFEPLYERRYGPDGESVVSPSGVLPEDEHAECVALNFRPHILDPAIRELVMKGFECLRGAPVSISPSPNDKHVTHSVAAPVVADGDGPVPLTTAPATDTAPPAPVAANSVSNSTTPDPERRLARLLELGGNATYKNGKWKITGISALVACEKSESRKRSDEKTIRADLKESAENEREAKRANAFSGLGQR